MKIKQIISLILTSVLTASSLNTVFSAEYDEQNTVIVEETALLDSALDLASEDETADETEYSGSSTIVTEEIINADFDSGICGSNLTWTFDSGTLTISGTGSMKSYTSDTSVPWYSERTSIVTIVIEDGVTSVGDYAFSYCTNLTGITMPDSIKTIGEYAFYYCANLTEVDIPFKVTGIGSRAFYYCLSLSSITLHGNLVKTIGEYAFSYCNFSTAGYFNGGYDFEFCWTSSIPDYAFDGCTSLKSITIPEGITSIGDCVFCNSTNLESIVLPDSLKSIGAHVFVGCESLNSITIPSKVTSIGECMFYRCSSLSSVIISNGVTSIGDEVFESCTSLTDITIPNSVTSIGDNAFESCTSLTDITIPDSVTSIGYGAFYNCTSLNSITIPDNVGKIAGSLFYGCTNLSSVTLPDSLASIDSSAFRGCTSLSSIDIPNRVVSVGSYAFRGCTSLTDIEVPNSVISIGDYAFYGCSNLSNVVLTDGLISIGNYAFYQCSKLSSITIPNSVKSIGSSVFYKALKTVYCYEGSVADDSSLYYTGTKIYYLSSDDEETESTTETTTESTTAVISTTETTTDATTESTTEAYAADNWTSGISYYGIEGIWAVTPAPDDNGELASVSFVRSEDGRGKVSNNDEEYPYYVTQLAEDANFTLSATVTVDSLVMTSLGANQISFGIVLRSTIDTADASYTATSSADRYTPSLMLHMVSASKISSDGSDYTGVNIRYLDKSATSAGYINIYNTEAGYITSGQTYDISVSKSGTTYSFNVTDNQTGESYSGSLSNPDVFSGVIYPGFFAARAVDVTYSNINLQVDSEPVATPAFKVVGVFGGRSVTFTSETDGAVIYYSSSTSNITTDDIMVENGGTVTYEDYYGTIYARAYYNGVWSDVNKFVLKIPVVNTPTVTASGSVVTIKSTTPSSFICYTTDGSDPVVETDGTVTNGTWLRVNGARTNSGTVTAEPGDTVRAVAVRSCFTTSASAAAYVNVSPAAFTVVGTFGGRNVTFKSDTSGAKIYYSSTTSSLTTSDKCVSNGDTVLFEDFYGTIYARAYYNGKWSNVSRLILKIPTINTPTVSYSGGKATIRTTTPNCYIYYTTDGSTPSVTNGKKLCSNSYGQVSVSSGTTIKAIAVRSCFTNSEIVSYSVS